MFLYIYQKDNISIFQNLKNCTIALPNFNKFSITLYKFLYIHKKNSILAYLNPNNCNLVCLNSIKNLNNFNLGSLFYQFFESAIVHNPEKTNGFRSIMSTFSMHELISACDKSERATWWQMCSYQLF